MGMEIIVIAMLVLLLFGGKRMPEVLRELGKASREFKRVRDELTDAVTREMNEASGKTKDASPAEKPAMGEETADAMHEGEIPPEYAEFATLPPELPAVPAPPPAVETVPAAPADAPAPLAVAPDPVSPSSTPAPSDKPNHQG